MKHLLLRRGWPLKGGLALALALATSLSLLAAGAAFANVSLTQISSDPFTAATCTANNTTSHHTEVEPESFSNGSTIVAAVQVGRIFDGGSCDIGFATSTNNGGSWTHGLLPGITKFSGGGPYDRVSDPSVAFDAKHNVWLISSLSLLESGGVHGAAVVTSRSTNGGLTWSTPFTVKTGADLDKNWIVCDNTASSPFYGNCYTEWDDHGAGNRIQMSTSSDGGQTWGVAKSTANNATGLGGQPVVQPNGTVIVPIANANETAIMSFRSLDGGVTWRRTVSVATVSAHTVAGGLRTGPLPSAEIDGAGKVYVVWQDCRFRSGCSSNDIVMSTSTTGTSWTAVTRVPIDATSSTVDHFIPGLAVDKATSGGSAKLGLAYYFYPTASCTSATCQLDVGFISSTTGGSTWGAATQLTGPMTLSWLAPTSQGRMVGDYISTSYGNESPSRAHPVFVAANAPSGGLFDEATYSPTSGLALRGATKAAANDTAVTSAGAGLAPVGAASLASAR